MCDVCVLVGGGGGEGGEGGEPGRSGVVCALGWGGHAPSLSIPLHPSRSRFAQYRTCSPLATRGFLGPFSSIRVIKSWAASVAPKVCQVKFTTGELMKIYGGRVNNGELALVEF